MQMERSDFSFEYYALYPTASTDMNSMISRVISVNDLAQACQTQNIENI